VGVRVPPSAPTTNGDFKLPQAVKWSSPRPKTLMVALSLGVQMLFAAQIAVAHRATHSIRHDVVVASASGACK